jgi:hypothetical protein
VKLQRVYGKLNMFHARSFFREAFYFSHLLFDRNLYFFLFYLMRKFENEHTNDIVCVNKKNDIVDQ